MLLYTLDQLIFDNFDIWPLESLLSHLKLPIASEKLHPEIDII